MPMRRDAYPENWDEISLTIREREGWKCGHCGVQNGLQIVRSSARPALYIVYEPETDRFSTVTGSPLWEGEIPDEFDTAEGIRRVTLTVHHIGIPKDDGTAGDPHDKTDCRPANLIALCQRCHLIADMPIHVANARKTRALKRDKRLQSEGNRLLFAE